MVRESDATRQPTPQDNQLMSKHRVLSLKPQLRLEWRGQDGQNETEQPDHSASLGDSITSSTRIRFSVHTRIQSTTPSYACATPTASGPVTGTLRMNLVFDRDFRSATTRSGVSNSLDAPRWTMGGSSSPAIRSKRATSAERNSAESSERQADRCCSRGDLPKLVTQSFWLPPLCFGAGWHRPSQPARSH